ncbi:putative secreted lipase [Pseudocercospora fuligena]|uniref:Carboxylic ester hydrolase n=1 Tax=Pseudocercospora fuligena TaxID=685502 RepID=A0A8H6VJ33_9PEZI|nr:putative secreted lipase [Pseudocercospora fuligena]
MHRSFSLLLLVAGLSRPSIAQSSSLFGLLSASTLYTGGPSPIVNLGWAQFQGKNDELTGTSNYLGIRYAVAPRFDHAQLFNGPLEGIQDVTQYGPICPQHMAVASTFAPDLGVLGEAVSYIEALPLVQEALQQSEDCLFINITFSDLRTQACHGGGFEVGSGASLLGDANINGVFYQGANIVKKSVAMGQPIVFASINYRLNHFGFTASAEFAQAGLLNVGLEDQRVAMRWIQQNIRAFGGDPSKVTIMGESAGAWSVASHLVAYGGNNEGLFRAAVAISGGPLKVDPPTRQQPLFDDLVQYVGCGSAPDKISCLRAAPYESIYVHMNNVNHFLLGFRSLASAWTVRPDGYFIPDSPHHLVAEGRIAPIPLLIGDMRDEGTLFCQTNSINITTTELVKDYFKRYWWPSITEDQLDQLLQLYPDDPTQGSPYDTGILYSLPLPQYKRLASIVGDYSFESQRRQLLGMHPAPKWSYLIEAALPLSDISSTFLGRLVAGLGNGLGLHLTSIPLLGSFHAFDIFFYWFGTIPEELSLNTRHLMSVLVSFVNHGDPNYHGSSDIPAWPQWDAYGKAAMRFQEQGVEVVRDDYREAQMGFLNWIADWIRL